MGRYPDELMADFQEYYNLNTEDFGTSISPKRAAALAAQLPRASRCVTAENPDASWDEQTAFISNIEYLLRMHNYSYSKEAKHGINKPKPNLTPSERKDIEGRIQRADPDDVARRLGIKT